MGEHITTSIVTILTAIVGVAILAVILSPKAQTANVITSGGTAFSGILNAAVAPVDGGGSLGSFNTGIGNITF